jgi:vacuolar-type H+-ATPase catalytic subunit A/Vma1
MEYHNAHGIALTLLTNIKKCVEKNLFVCQSESSNISNKNEDSVQQVTIIFWKHFWALVNKKTTTKICVLWYFS